MTITQDLSTITQDLLKELFNYDPETGVFIYRIARGSRGIKGSAAGRRSSNGYIGIQINSKKYLAHRLAWLYMTGSWPTSALDHMDGDKINNRFANLRMVTESQNRFNSGINKNNTSGYRGVCKVKTKASNSPTWKAAIMVNGKLTYLGCYDTPEQASKAYMFAAENVLERVDFILMRDKLES